MPESPLEAVLAVAVIALLVWLGIRSNRRVVSTPTLGETLPPPPEGELSDSFVPSTPESIEAERQRIRERNRRERWATFSPGERIWGVMAILFLAAVFFLAPR